MKLSTFSLSGVSMLLAASAALAQAPAAPPAGSTGLCKDGSYTSNETKKGACAGHKGVKDWFDVAAASAGAMKPASAATKTGATTPATAAAAGGGPGQVWVNTSSKVYHCSGTKYYGKTKKGEYMTEAAAKSAGAHADHGKACS